ncbi:MAG: 4Fe-4S dicluster domain-containing protein [Oscillospiraceae bacterium]
MLELFHRPEWDQLSESCLGCGACTFACPTCQCYDIKEFTGNREILRYRCWDSCMYSDFTIMSAGQPRPTQKERFRQRFLHKLQYFPVNQGDFRLRGLRPVPAAVPDTHEYCQGDENFGRCAP